MLNNEIKQDKNNSGSVLLAVTTALIIVSLIALSAIELSLTENKITLSVQDKNQIFLLANSEIEAHINSFSANIANFSNAISAPQTLTPQINPLGCSNSDGDCQQVTLTFIQNTLPPTGYSIEQNVGYSGSLFEIESTARSQTNGAASSQTQGIIVINY